MAWATSFRVGERLFNLWFEVGDAGGDDYRPFCEEQKIRCAEIVVVKFDNEYNAMPEDQYRRLDAVHRMQPNDMTHLARVLVGGIARFVRIFDPDAIVGIPNDRKLSRWYDRLTMRFDLPGRLISMRGSAYVQHRMLVIQKADDGHKC